MAATSVSSSTAYATGSDLLVYHDSRKLADLLNDDGTRNVDPANSATVTRMLKRASGEIESAVLKGKRYEVADLAALTGVSLEMLVGLTCDLAFWHLCKRRHKLAIKADEVAGVQEAKLLLKDLESGEAIFSFAETADAGTAHTYAENMRDKYNRQGVATIADDFFGPNGRKIRNQTPTGEF